MTKHILAFIFLLVACFSQFRTFQRLPLTVAQDVISDVVVADPIQISIPDQTSENGSRYNAVLTVNLNGQTTTVTSQFVVVSLPSCFYNKCYAGYVTYLEIQGEKTQGYGSSQLKVQPIFTFSTSGTSNYVINYSNDLDDIWKELIENFCQRLNNGVISPPSSTSNFKASTARFASQDPSLRFSATASPYGNRIATSQVQAPVQNVQYSQSRIQKQIILNTQNQIGKLSEAYTLKIDGNSAQRSVAGSQDSFGLDVAIKFDLTLKQSTPVSTSTIDSIRKGLAFNSQSVTQKRKVGDDKPDYLKDIVTTTTAPNGIKTKFQKQSVQVSNFPLNTDILNIRTAQQAPTFSFSQALPTSIKQSAPIVAKTLTQTANCEKTIHTLNVLGLLLQINSTTECSQDNYNATCKAKMKFYYGGNVLEAQQFWFQQQILSGGSYSDVFTGSLGRYVWINFPYYSAGVWLYVNINYQLNVNLATSSELLIPPNSLPPFTLKYNVNANTNYQVTTYSVAEIRPYSNLRLKITFAGSLSNGNVVRSVQMKIGPPFFNTIVTDFSSAVHRNYSEARAYYARNRRFLWIWWGWNDYYISIYGFGGADFALCSQTTTAPFP